MDLDTTSKKGGHQEILSAFAREEADILIGTQMIVKGHDFQRSLWSGSGGRSLPLCSGLPLRGGNRLIF
mgnify:CR=1 FL=1